LPQIHDLDLGYGTREQVEGYLRELGPAGGGARALTEMRADGENGRISAFGAGVNSFGTPQHCDEFARRIADICDLDFYLIAGSEYTLLSQKALDVQFPVMEERDMTAVGTHPQAHR
jgi:aryl-alcohol dehydrogenase-like predicted oxidoreductase